MPKSKTPKEETPEVTPPEVVAPVGKSETEVLKEQVAELRKMLIATADAGRLMNFESSKSGSKKPMRVHISHYADGIITGWRTIKDELIKHPMTGQAVGEEQQYELLILMPDDSTKKTVINGYPAFSEARYGKRDEVEVVAKSEDWNGEVTFDIALADGRTIKLGARFIN